MKRVFAVLAVWVAVTAWAAVALDPAGGATGPPVGGAGRQSCMAEVYEALGIWAFYPAALAGVWGIACAWLP